MGENLGDSAGHEALFIPHGLVVFPEPGARSLQTGDSPERSSSAASRRIPSAVEILGS